MSNATPARLYCTLVGAVQWDSPEAIALIRRYLDS